MDYRSAFIDKSDYKPKKIYRNKMKSHRGREEY